MPAGQMLNQRYRLLQTVGQGGMGAVYVAQDTQLGDRLVAVKEMSMSRLAPQDLPQAVEQFRREAHLLASLNHHNLPVIHEYFNEGDRWYLVMSFIEGGTLQGALETAPGKRLPIHDVVRIGIELCDVLDYLHTHQPQIIFRDLKPSNIMISPKGIVYLIDFGIARHFKQEQSKDTAYYYSVGYAPPEQYGQAQTGPRSDIYSLGVTLYQMLSGHNPSSKPFQFPNLQLIDASIPLPLAKLLSQMLEMNEQQRPNSMVEVKAQLEKVQQSAPLTATIQAGGTQDVKVKTTKSKVDQQKKVRQNTSNVWNKIGGIFSSKKRIIAWLCFIVLSLAMVWPSTIIKANDSYGSVWNDWTMSAGTWLFIVGIAAAIVGSIFVLLSGQSLVDILGGIAFTLLGNLTLLTALSFGAYPPPPYIDNSSWLTIWLGFSQSFIPLIVLFSTLLLLIGTRSVLRRANRWGSFIFGLFLIAIGTIVAIIVQNKLDFWHAQYISDLANNSATTYYYIPPVPLTTLTWLLSITLGLTSIFKARKRDNKSNEQLPTA